MGALQVQGNLGRWRKLWSALRKNSLGDRNKSISALRWLPHRSQDEVFLLRCPVIILGHVIIIVPPNIDIAYYVPGNVLNVLN